MDEPRSPVEAVRAFFESDESVRHATGRLRELLEVEDEVQRAMRTETHVDLRKVEERERTADEARVDIRGTSAGKAEHRGHELRVVHALDGPVRVVHEDGDWKVADFHRNGLSVVRSVAAPGAVVATLAGVHVRTLCTVTERGLRVALNVVNTRRAEVVLDRIVVRTRTLLGVPITYGGGLRDHVVPAEGRWAIAFAMGRIPLSNPFHVELRFAARSGQPALTFAFTPPSLPLRAHVRRVRRQLVWTVLLALALLVWAATGDMLWTALLLFLGGVYWTNLLALTLITGVHSAGAMIRGTAGVAALAAGAVLLARSDFGLQQTLVLGGILAATLAPTLVRAWRGARGRPQARA